MSEALYKLVHGDKYPEKDDELTGDFGEGQSKGVEKLRGLLKAVQDAAK